MGTIPLAYPMRKHKTKEFDARFVVMLFDGSYRLLNELKQDLDGCEQIFRFAIYKQKDKFRDAYDEYYYHHGVEMGKTFEKRQQHLNEIQKTIHERQTDALEYWKKFAENEQTVEDLGKDISPENPVIWDVVSKAKERARIEYDEYEKKMKQKEQRQEQEKLTNLDTQAARREKRENLGKRKIVKVEGEE